MARLSVFFGNSVPFTALDDAPDVWPWPRRSRTSGRPGTAGGVAFVSSLRARRWILSALMMTTKPPVSTCGVMRSPLENLSGLGSDATRTRKFSASIKTHSALNFVTAASLPSSVILSYPCRAGRVLSPVGGPNDKRADRDAANDRLFACRLTRCRVWLLTRNLGSDSPFALPLPLHARGFLKGNSFALCKSQRSQVNENFATLRELHKSLVKVPPRGARALCVTPDYDRYVGLPIDAEAVIQTQTASGRRTT